MVDLAVAIFGTVWYFAKQFKLNIEVKNRTELDIIKCKCVALSAKKSWKSDIVKQWQDITIPAGKDREVGIRTWYFAGEAILELTFTFNDKSKDVVQIDAQKSFTFKKYEHSCFKTIDNAHDVKSWSGGRPELEKGNMVIQIKHTPRELYIMRQRKADKLLLEYLNRLIARFLEGNMSIEELEYFISRLEKGYREANLLGTCNVIQGHMNSAMQQLDKKRLKQAEELEDTNYIKALEDYERIKRGREKELIYNDTYENRQKLEDAVVLIKTAKEYNELVVIQNKVLQMENGPEKVNQMSKLINKLNGILKQLAIKTHSTDKGTFARRTEYVTAERDDLQETLSMLVTSNQLKVTSNLEKDIAKSEDDLQKERDETQRKVEAKSQYEQRVHQMTAEEKELEEELADLEFDVIEEAKRGISFEENHIYEEDEILNPYF